MQKTEDFLIKAEKAWGNRDLLDISVKAKVFDKMSGDPKLRRKVPVIDFAMGHLRPWPVYRPRTKRIIADLLQKMEII